MTKIRRLLIIIFSIAICIAIAGCLNSSQETAQRNFIDLHPDQVANDNAKVAWTAVAYFSYECPHCYKFEPRLSKWESLHAGRIQLRREYASFGRSATPCMKMFYALKMMGIESKYRLKIFSAIHEHGQRFSKDADVLDFISTLGIDRDDFKLSYESDKLKNAIEEVKQKEAELPIALTPSIILGDRYLYNPDFLSRKESNVLLSFINKGVDEVDLQDAMLKEISSRILINSSQEEK